MSNCTKTDWGCGLTRNS